MSFGFPVRAWPVWTLHAPETALQDSIVGTGDMATFPTPFWLALTLVDLMARSRDLLWTFTALPLDNDLRGSVIGPQRLCPSV